MRTRRLMRGCLLLLLAGCLAVSASLAIAGMRFGPALLTRPKHATLLNLGSVWIGDPCRRIQEQGMPVGCSGFHVVVVVNIDGQDHTLGSLPYLEQKEP